MSEQNQNDVDRIIGFLVDSREGIQVVITDLDMLAVEPFRGNIGYFRESTPRINYLTENAILYLRENRTSSELLGRLDEVGLTGNDLNLKLIMFDRAKQFFYNARNAIREGGGRLLGKLRAGALRYLDVINTILDSLIKVITYLEPVAEIKKHLEVGIRKYEELQE